ncbi:MAG TPA: hypothetical protein VGE51_15770 [Fontimonas sp.]
MADADRQDSVLNGAALLAGLADFSLAPSDFNHRAHVCAAWQCLRDAAPELAAERFVGLIKGYVGHLGAQDKYHHTLTLALLQLIHARMTDSAADWSGFMSANPDLFGNARGLLARHYSDARLHSPTARREFVAPDLEPLPG